MKSLDKIQQEALLTHDPRVLYKLLEEAIEYAKFQESRYALSVSREQKYKAQIERQTQMITNLENTLWKKK